MCLRVCICNEIKKYICVCSFIIYYIFFLSIWNLFNSEEWKILRNNMNIWLEYLWLIFVIYNFIDQNIFVCEVLLQYRVRVMVFNATFNNISVISWQSVLLVEETEIHRENQGGPHTQKYSDQWSYRWQKSITNILIKYSYYVYLHTVVHNNKKEKWNQINVLEHLHYWWSQ
jgi:hypothetical protein